MVTETEILERAVENFPNCPICGSDLGYIVTSVFKGSVQCRSCQAEWSSVEFVRSTRLERIKIRQLPGGVHSYAVGQHLLKQGEEYPVSLWKTLEEREERKLDLRSLIRELSILFVIVIVGGYFRLANLTEISSWHDYDEGVHSQAAILYIQGYAPYKDFFFTHPPLILYVLNILYRLNGPNLGAGRMFSAVLSTITIMTVYFVGRMSGSSITGYIASAFVAFDGYTIYNSRKLMLEPTTNFFTCLSYLAFLHSVEKKDRGAKDGLMLLSGVLMGLSISTKMTAVFNWAPLLLYLVLKRDKRATSLFLLSSLASVGILLIPFLSSAPAEVIKQILVFQVLRPPDGTPRDERFAWMTSFLHDMVIVNLGIISLVVLLLAYLVTYRMAHSVVKSHITLPMLWALSVLFMFFTTKSFYGHYTEQIIPPFALLIGNLAVAIPNAISNLQGKGKATGKILKIILTLMFVLAVITQLIIIGSQRIPTWEDDWARRIADQLVEFTWSDDRILTFEPLLTFMAERSPAGLMCDSYGTMLYIGLGLHEEDLTSALIRALTEREYPMWPMNDPRAQEYIVNLVNQSDYIVIGDYRSRWQLKQETVDYILSRTTVVRNLGDIQVLTRLNSNA